MRPQLTLHPPRPFSLSRLLACAVLSCGLGCGLAGCGMSSGVFVAESDAPDDGDTMPSPKPMDGGTSNDEGGSNGSSGRPDRQPVVRLPCGTGTGCDPSDLGGETCETLGLGKGTLLCNTSTCTFETQLCNGLGELPPCGTGPGCDTTNLGGATCESLGMPTGVLACDPVTCAYDTAGCIAMTGLLAGGLFGGGTTTTDADGGVAFFGGGLFGGTAAGGLFGAGGGTFGGVPGVPGAAAADEAAP